QAVQIQAVTGSGTNVVGVAGSARIQMFSHVRPALQGRRQRSQKLLHRSFIRVALNELSHFPNEDTVEFAAIDYYFKTNQVQRLDTVGSFIDLSDPDITYQLLLTPLTDVAVTTKYLLTQHAALKATVGHERLGNRSQQRNHRFSLGFFFSVVAELGNIQSP